MTACALICTRNGRLRLGETLRALVRQRDLPAAALQIVVVDNGSTDDTAAFAEAELRTAPFPTRVLRELRPGQMAAFRRGLEGNTADIIIMVDDDNILAPDFVARVLGHFAAHSDVGVIGSHNVAAFPADHAPPSWFITIAGKYACSPPEGFATPPQPVPLAIIPGAGCSFRRAPLQAAWDAGYEFINDTTREGGLWITGMDTEWCYLFAALGWKFLYDPALRLSHVMTAERLTWTYARRLARTMGTGAAGIDPFIIFCDPSHAAARNRRASWVWQAISKLRRLLRHGPQLYRLLFPGFEGDLRVIDMEQDFGALLRVLHERGDYTAHLQRTRTFLAQHAVSRP
jgi:glycosyltransferase involved in cell wall biosynthesis